MSIQTAAGSRIFIGPAVTEAEADTLGEFQGLVYTEIGEVENLGEFGDTAGQTTFTALNNRRARKFKTSYDAGNVELTVGFDAGDAGQDALVAAFTSDSDFALKVMANDGSEGSPSQPSTFYFRAKVMSKPVNIGTVDNVVRRRFTLAVNSEVFEVAPV